MKSRTEYLDIAPPWVTSAEFDAGWARYAETNGQTIYSPLDFIAAKIPDDDRATAVRKLASIDRHA